MTVPSTIIVIPCYNEAERLDVDAFRRYASSGRGARFLFVDDGSSDGTAGVLRSLEASDPESFGVLVLPRNAGKAEAVRQGFLKAFELSPDFVGFWDADLATPLPTINEFVDLLEARPDLLVIFGSRVNLLGRSVHRNLMRHYVGRVFATAAAFVLALPIYDTQCGAKLFRVSPETRDVFREPFLSRWIFDVEIVARLDGARGGGRRPARDTLYEHPLMVWRDVKGSKLRLRHFVTVAIDLARIFLKHHR